MSREVQEMNGMERIVSGARRESDWRVKKEKEKETAASRTASQCGSGGAAAVWGENFADVNSDEWPQTLLACAEQIKKSYPGIYFNFESFTERSEIDDLAKFYGGGVHFAVAPDFLQRMAASSDAFGEGMTALQKFVKQMHTMAKQVAADGKLIVGMGVAVKEDGTASIWTLAQDQPKLPDFFTQQKKKAAEELMTVRYYKEKGGRNITEIKGLDGSTTRFIFTKRINYSASSDVGRLARFTDVGSVRAFIGGRRAYMNRISKDPCLDKDEVRQAVAQMQGVLRRARKKVQDLNGEGSLESVRRRALEAKKKKRAEKIANELNRRRTLRKSREFSESHAFRVGSDITTELRYEREERSAEAYDVSLDGVSTAAAELAALEVVSAELNAAGGESAPAAAPAAVMAAAVDVRV